MHTLDSILYRLIFWISVAITMGKKERRKKIGVSTQFECGEEEVCDYVTRAVLENTNTV